MAGYSRLFARAMAVLALVSCCSVTFAATDINGLAPPLHVLAPPLHVRELDGHIFRLAAQRGKVVLVNFWATWCPPCREEIPVLNSFYRRFHARGVEIIGLSVNSRRGRNVVTKIARSLLYPAAMLTDAKVNGFGFPVAVPITYVVDPNGILRAILQPGRTRIDSKTLRKVVLPLLKQDQG